MTGVKRWVILLVVFLAAFSVSMREVASNANSLEDQAFDGSGVSGQALSPDDDDDEGDDPGEDQDDDDGNDDGPGDDDQDDEEDEDEDEDEDEEEREVHIELEDEDQEVTIRLESTTPEREDEIKVHFQADEGELKVSLERDAGTEEEVEMRVTFHRVLEFRDTGGDGGFNPADDPVLQQFFVEALDVTDLATALFEVDGKTGHQVTVEYAFPGTVDGRFGLVFWVFGQFAVVNGVLLGPSEVKIDILIEGFPFQEEDTTVAVDLRIETEFEVETEGLTLEEVIALGQEHAAFFRWSEEATVDGVTQPVTSTVVRQRMEASVEEEDGEFENETLLFLAYVRGTAIVHDPTVGVQTLVAALVGAFPSFALGIGFATALALVGGVWILTRRRS